MRPVRAVGVVLVVVALLSNCGLAAPASDPTAPGLQSSSAATGPVCGMNRADVEAITGRVVEPWSDGLTVADGVGEGECVGWIGRGVSEGDVLVRVVFAAASSEEAADRRAKIAGEVDGVVAPAAVYSEREGAIWGDALDTGESSPWGANSYVFVGDTMVTIQLTRGAAGRDRVADHLALTEQVAATYGLDAGSGS